MKFMNMKRFGSVVMAGALALSLAVPAFATTSTPDGQVTITGSYEDIPITVSVPSTGTAQINPYGLPVTITKSDGVNSVSISGQQITSRPLNIKNQGETKLAVNASLLVAPTGDLSIIASNGSLGDGKDAKVSLEVAGLNSQDYAASSLDPTLEDKLLDAFVDDATWANAKSLAAPGYAKGATAPSAAKSASAMAVLGAATVSAGMTTYGKDSIALFRLTGEVVEEPNDGQSTPTDTPWAETDGFTATVVFKFKPAKAASLSLDKTSLALTTATSGTTNVGTVKVTLNPGDTDLTVKSYAWTADPATSVTLADNTTAEVTVTCAAVLETTLTCTVTLSDDSTLTATCAVACTAP